MDLTNFLLANTDKPLRDAHLDELLHIYYTNLSNTIRATCGDPEVLFPEPELHQQLRQFAIFGVMVAPLVIPVILADPSEIMNLEDTAETMSNGSDEPIFLAKLSDPLKIKRCAERLKDVMADARQKGWI